MRLVGLWPKVSHRAVTGTRYQAQIIFLSLKIKMDHNGDPPDFSYRQLLSYHTPSQCQVFSSTTLSKPHAIPFGNILTASVSVSGSRFFGLLTLKMKPRICCLALLESLCSQASLEAHSETGDTSK